MESGLFSSTEFPTFAADVVLFCHITSLVEGEPYPDLLSEMGGRGFPTIKFLDAEGGILGEPAGRSIESFEATLGTIDECAALEAKADRSEEEEVRLFNAQLELGQLSFEEASARSKGLKGLSDEQRAELDSRLTAMEVEAIFSAIKSEDDVPAAVDKVVAMAKQGRGPTGQGRIPFQFWMMTAGWAKENSDVDLFEMAYEGIKKVVGDNPRAAQMLGEMQADLDAMRDAGEEEVEEPEEDPEDGDRKSVV